MITIGELLSFSYRFFLNDGAHCHVAASPTSGFYFKP